MVQGILDNAEDSTAEQIATKIFFERVPVEGGAAHPICP